jgi:hypothetical protein
MHKEKQEIKEQPAPLNKRPVGELIKEAKEKRDRGESPWKDWINRKVDK